MAGRGHAPRHFWLSSQAAFAAERLAEIAGVPAGEMVEMVLLELAGSGEDYCGGRGEGIRTPKPLRARRFERRVVARFHHSPPPASIPDSHTDRNGAALARFRARHGRPGS
jgi:hypothetical protein